MPKLLFTIPFITCYPQPSVSQSRKYFRYCFLLLAVILLSACATTNTQTDAHSDPLESFNRKVYTFNKTLDKNLFNPLSRLYQAITPDTLNKGISNVFSNLNSPANIVNNLLQGKLDSASTEIARTVFNTTLGIGGLFDVGKRINLPAHPEDFGQTLAVWGLPPGPFLIVPFFGPATLRDIPSAAIDRGILSPISYVSNVAYRGGLMGLSYIDFQSDLKGAKKVLGSAAIDEYSFVRSVYFQKRKQLIEE